MNSQEGEMPKNAKMGNASSWINEAITPVGFGLTLWDARYLTASKKCRFGCERLEPWGGLVFGIAWLIPKIGTETVFVATITGQAIADMVGWSRISVCWTLLLAWSML